MSEKQENHQKPRPSKPEHWVPEIDPQRLDESIANRKKRELIEGEWKMQAPDPWPDEKKPDEPKPPASFEG